MQAATLSHPALAETSHRPWPLPRGPWRWRQSWHDLLFMHWPVPANLLKPHVARGLTVDTWRGRAWVGVVPFRMTGVARRGLPALPGLSAFPEMNVRTYVRWNGRPGVWFLSLDAASRAAVWAARRWFHLPYHHARMGCAREGESVRYWSDRVRGNAGFSAVYRPSGPPFRSQEDGLEAWLTERYCLYASRGTTLMTADIHHRSWPLQRAEAEVSANTMLAPFGITTAGAPLLHFARRLDVVVWGVRPCEGGSSA